MIFRIVQEGFTNIARHARASHAWLSLRRQRDALLVEIGDDGKGFDLTQANGYPDTYGGMGLSNVRERVRDLGGILSIWSLQGRGTTLHLCIPLVKPLQEVQEQERRNREFAGATRQTRQILYAGTLLAELVAALMLFYVPPSIALLPVLTCIIVAFACWLWAQQHRLRISLEFGREHPLNFALLAESKGLLAGILLLCLLCPTYFMSLYNPFYLSFISDHMWLAAAFFGIFISALITTYVHYSRIMDRYYKTISYEASQVWVRQQLQHIVIDWIAWTVMVALAIFLLNFFPAIATDPVMQGTDFVLLCAWFIIILLKSLRIARWHTALRLLAKRAVQDRRGGSA